MSLPTPGYNQPMADRHEPGSTEASTAPPTKAPYEKPVLRIFGGVAAMTGTLNMSSNTRDGGPTNTKT